MRIIIIYILCLFSFALSAQTFSIKGKITDAESKQKIAYATIQLDSTSEYITTDVNGAYELENVKPGTYTIQVYAFGYKKLAEKLVVSDKNIKKDFQLVVVGMVIDTVTVSA